jgi:hypothetical protein
MNGGMLLKAADRPPVATFALHQRAEAPADGAVGEVAAQGGDHASELIPSNLRKDAGVLLEQLGGEGIRLNQFPVPPQLLLRGRSPGSAFRERRLLERYNVVGLDRGGSSIVSLFLFVRVKLASRTQLESVTVASWTRDLVGRVCEIALALSAVRDDPAVVVGSSKAGSPLDVKKAAITEELHVGPHGAAAHALPLGWQHCAEVFR